MEVQNSTSNSEAALKTQVAVSVHKKALAQDVQVLKLLDTLPAVDPNLGANIDVSA